MIAVDLNNDVIIPSGVAIVGAIVAGISAVLKSWFENRDARSRGDRKLDLATKRTAFAKDWIDISMTLSDVDADADTGTGTGTNTGTPTDTPTENEDATPTAVLVKRAQQELRQAARETERAFYDATTDTSTGLRQLRRLLMLVRRVNLASYVVSGTFVFMSVFAWLLLCIPSPGVDDFSVPAAIFEAIVATIVLRVLAGLLVSALERRAIGDEHRIKDVSVQDDVVTVTTWAPHGLSKGDEVTIDASDDRFDGTFKNIGVPDTTSFEFELTAPNAESLPGVKGWVCGESVNDQMRRLFLIPTSAPPTRRSHLSKAPAWAIAALFIVPLLVFAVFAVRDSKNDFDSAGYPRCIGDPYDGAYFGGDSFFDPFLEPVEVYRFLEQAPTWSENKLRFNIDTEPVGSPSDDGGSGYLRSGDDSESLKDVSFTLVDDNGDRYTLDRNGGLRYENNRTELYRKVGVSQLEMVGDPCDPQQLTVSAYRVAPDDGPPPVAGKKEGEAWIDSNGKIWRWEEEAWTPKPDVEDPYYSDDLSYTVFRYYDDSKGYGTGGEFTLLLGDTGDATTKKISAFFGRDGRLIPVCDTSRYPEIQPCLDRGDAYLDSGLDAAVTRAFWTGLLILSAAILWRLLFWAAHKLVGMRAREDPTHEDDPEPADSAAVVA